MHESASGGHRVQFGPFVLDLRSGELGKESTRLKVPSQSIEILKALLEHPGELVTREQLRERLWPSDTFVDFEHGLNAAVRRLREALGDSADAPAFIETLPRRGYRFIAPIDSPPSAIVVIAAPRRARIRMPYVAAAAVVAMVFGVLTLAMFRHRGAATAPPSPKIVPVTNFTGFEADAAISPDGRHVAFTWDGESGTNRDIYLKFLAGGSPQRITTDPAIDRAPSWSPDGASIAFLRRQGETTGAQIIIVPAFGGPERRVKPRETAEIGHPVWSFGISWAPLGDAIAFEASLPPTSNSGVVLCFFESGEVRQLTHPPSEAFDASPAISPDGRWLAFVRHIKGFSAGRVFVQRLERLKSVGDSQPLTAEQSTDNVTWSPDGHYVVFDGAIGGVPGIWRVSVRGGALEALVTNVAARHPSMSRDGRRIVYHRNTGDLNIWKAALDAAAGDFGRPIIDSTAFDTSPQFSDDGQRIVFTSTRAGGNAVIWVARSDGSGARPVSTAAAGFSGTPRWNPDGSAIAFDSMRTGSYNIYAIDADVGREHAITNETSNNVRPSWSRDGRWIYFGSDRSGKSQIWKIRSEGGPAVPITKNGGLEAFESADGRHLYYTINGIPGIWRVPVDGGNEVRVIDHGREGSWALTDTSIVLLNRVANPSSLSNVEVFDLSAPQPRQVMAFPRDVRFDMANPCFAVTRDGRWMLYVRNEHWGADIDMLEQIK